MGWIGSWLKAVVSTVNEIQMRSFDHCMCNTLCLICGNAGMNSGRLIHLFCNLLGLSSVEDLELGYDQ
jgi:hypothetical protein